MWRNTDLDFGTVPALIASLEIPPQSADLMRVRESDDLSALKQLWADPDICDMTGRGDRVRLLWEVCQIPDFRKMASTDHVTILSRIYRFLLADAGVIPSDWIAGQVKRIDRVDGDIDALSKRLAFIRTWTYVANRSRWLDDPDGWRETTREVEDRLSEALHKRLTQRFVDRRTSVLMRRLKQKERLVAELNDKGEVSVDGHFLGRLDGFRFTVDETAEGEEIKTLRTASQAALQAEFARRADKLYISPDTELEVTEQGGLMWGADAIGRLEKGDSALAPRLRVFVDEIAEPAVAEKVERRLSHWITRRISTLFEPLLTMRDDEAVTGLARGVAFQVAEAMGVVPRRQIADDIKALGQDERALLRKHGVRFGQHSIFMPLLLKPAPTRLRLILWSLWEGFEVFAEAPPPGLVTIPALADAARGYYEKVGYRLCGPRALRIDMLERLADLIRPMDVRGGFEATPDMLSITGCTLEQIAELLKSLGFDGERGERPKAARVVSDATGEATADATDAEVAPKSEVGPEGDLESTPEAKETPDAEAAAPVVQTPAEPDAAAPEPAESAEAIDGSASADAETGEIGACETQVSETQAGGDETGVPEIEVFYTFKLRPRHQPGSGGPRRRGAGGGDASGGERGKKYSGKPGASARGKGDRKGKGPRRDRSSGNDAPKPKPNRPRREEKPLDPLSPFAILQQLKDK